MFVCATSGAESTAQCLPSCIRILVHRKTTKRWSMPHQKVREVYFSVMRRFFHLLPGHSPVQRDTISRRSAVIVRYLVAIVASSVYFCSSHGAIVVYMSGLWESCSWSSFWVGFICTGHAINQTIPRLCVLAAFLFFVCFEIDVRFFPDAESLIAALLCSLLSTSCR